MFSDRSRNTLDLDVLPLVRRISHLATEVEAVQGIRGDAALLPRFEPATRALPPDLPSS